MEEADGAAEGGGDGEGTRPQGRAELQLVTGSVTFILSLELERIWQLFLMHPHGLKVQLSPKKPLKLLGQFREKRTNPHRKSILTSALPPFPPKQYFLMTLQTTNYLNHTHTHTPKTYPPIKLSGLILLTSKDLISMTE